MLFRVLFVDELGYSIIKKEGGRFQWKHTLEIRIYFMDTVCRFKQCLG
jgi:hypothetical protein